MKDISPPPPLGSRDKAKFVSQEAYDRASLPENSAHVISNMLLLFVKNPNSGEYRLQFVDVEISAFLSLLTPGVLYQTHTLTD